MTRRRKMLVRLLLLVFVGVAAISCNTSASSTEIGMTIHSRGVDAATLKRQFDIMADMKVAWIRVDIDWSVIESERGQYDWSYPDMVVDEAVARGMNVLTVLAYSPNWSHSSDTDAPESARSARPHQLSDYAAFARTATDRYAPRGVHTWEIWNEPNTTTFWPPRPDADEYAAVFRVAAEAIRGSDPESTVLIGSLGPKFETPEAEVAPTDYLEQLYENGAAQLADGVAAHPYSFPALPMDDNQRMTGGFKDLPTLHNVMQRHGDGTKKVWITEFGAPTGTDPHAVSEEDQTAILIEARDQVQQWDWTGPLIYYELVDGGTDLSDKEQNFGVLYEDLAPKPAAISLLDAASS